MTFPPALLTRARAAARPEITGSVSGAMGLTLSVDGISAAVGDLVEVNPGDRGLLAEVVAVGRERLTCMPMFDWPEHRYTSPTSTSLAVCATPPLLRTLSV